MVNRMRTLILATMVLLSLMAAPDVAAEDGPVAHEFCFATLGVCVSRDAVRDPNELIRDLIGPCTCDPIP